MWNFTNCSKISWPTSVIWDWNKLFLIFVPRNPNLPYLPFTLTKIWIPAPKRHSSWQLKLFHKISVLFAYYFKRNPENKRLISNLRRFFSGIINKTIWNFVNYSQISWGTSVIWVLNKLLIITKFSHSNDEDDSWKATWYVTSREDIGDFYIVVREIGKKPLIEQDVVYNERSFKVHPLEKSLSKYELCVLARDSIGNVKHFRDSQCQILNQKFSNSGSISLPLSAISLVFFSFLRIWKKFPTFIKCFEKREILTKGDNLH